jgi:hypothetical protein
MTNLTFDEFVKNQQVPEFPEIYWNTQRDEWLQHLNELFQRIRKFLKEYIDSGKMQFEPHSIELNEEFGVYVVPQYTLKIGRKKVIFQPVGTLLIGSKGRVDVVGPAGTVVPLLLVNSKAVRASDMVRDYVGMGGRPLVVSKKESGKIKWEWKMITRPPERRFIEITQETFFQMIMEVANG